MGVYALGRVSFHWEVPPTLDVAGVECPEGPEKFLDTLGILPPLAS
jgi:hypothetical protein